MCGIGVLITPEITEEILKEYKEVLEHQESRGGDSVGIFVGNEKKNFITYNLSRRIENSWELMLKTIEEFDMWGEPGLFLGHTRAKATGSTDHFHPALNKAKTSVMIHNNIVTDIKGSYYHDNDTYHLNEVMTREVHNKREKKGMKKRLSCHGSTLFWYQIDKKMLEFFTLDPNPLILTVAQADRESVIMSSIAPFKIKENFIDVKKGFYQVDMEQFFSTKKIEIKKGIQYVAYPGSGYNPIWGINLLKRSLFKEKEEDGYFKNWCPIYRGDGECFRCEPCYNKKKERAIALTG